MIEGSSLITKLKGLLQSPPGTAPPIILRPVLVVVSQVLLCQWRIQVVLEKPENSGPACYRSIPLDRAPECPVAGLPAIPCPMPKTRTRFGLLALHVRTSSVDV
jgi:hypothetical protein